MRGLRDVRRFEYVDASNTEIVVRKSINEFVGLGDLAGEGGEAMLKSGVFKNFCGTTRWTPRSESALRSRGEHFSASGPRNMLKLC